MDLRSVILLVTAMYIVAAEENVVWSPWESWSLCSVTCGSGEMRRRRVCSADPSMLQCHVDQRRTCILVNCSTPDENAWRYRSWSQWSSCSLTCGNGAMSRTRKCKDDRRTRECTQSQAKSCFTECRMGGPTKWNSWGEWSECSVTCGGGKRTRVRFCAELSSGSCKQLQIDRNCGWRICPGGFWASWSRWSVCPLGQTTQIRYRNCINGRPGGLGCPGRAKEIRSCSQNTYLPGRWGSWSSWSIWNGSKVRTRSCIGGTPGFGRCSGSQDEFVECEDELCKDEWLQWSSWSECSASCGLGSRVRTRRCGTNMGECKGASLEKSMCYSPPCPSEWESWSAWSSCSVTCGYGIQTRSRICKAGWHGCSGKSDDETVCLQPECRRDKPAWTTWGNWIPCSATCGPGWMSKKRICMEGRELSAGCEGSSKRDLRCSVKKCPEVIDWGPWSECSVDCGSGIQIRTRACTPTEVCESGEQREETACNTQNCMDVGRRCGQAGYDRNILGLVMARIARGDRAAIAAWPWQVMFVRNDSDAYETFKNLVGGGSLVNNKWILTAAHLFPPNVEKEYMVVLGVTRVPRAPEPIPPHIIFAEISSVQRHPLFKTDTLDYDAALIRLGRIIDVDSKGKFLASPKRKSPLVFNDYIKPVCLPCISAYSGAPTTSVEHGVEIRPLRNKACKAEEGNLVKPGTRLVATGYGDIQPALVVGPDAMLPFALLQGALELQHPDQCKEGEERLRQLGIETSRYTNRMLCTQSASKRKVVDACRGDSGGPLVTKVTNPNGAYWVQVGIISWGVGCAFTLEDNFTIPGYYTNVAKLRSWIWRTVSP